MIAGSIILRDFDDWKVYYFLAVDSDDAYMVLDKMEDVGCGDKVLNKAEKMLTGECCNVGFSWTSRRLKKSLITCSKTQTFKELINTFAHEVDHVEKHIAKALGFEAYSERASRLVGEMVAEIARSVINKLLCE